MSVMTNRSISLQGCDATHRWFVPSPGTIAQLAWIAGLAGLCSSHPASADPAASCRQAWMPSGASAFCPWRSEAPLPAPKSYFAAASSRDNIYVLGGFRLDATTNQLIDYDTVRRGKISYAYVSPKLALPDTIGRGRIAPSEQLAGGRAGHGVVTYRDRRYVSAGSAPGGQFLKEVLPQA